MRALFYPAFYLALYAAGAAAMKQSWAFEREDRSHFLIERFGFGSSGRMDVRVSDVAIAPAASAVDVQAGLLFVHQDELWETVALLDDAVGSADLQDDDPMLLATGQAQAQDASAGADKCALQLRRDSRWVDLTDARTWNVSRGSEQVALAGREGGGRNGPLRVGFYYVFYAQCTPGLQVSFHMEAMFQNGAKDFFSVGDAPLPVVYLTTSLLFLAAAAAWGRCLVLHREYVQRVHWLMAMLVGVKTVALFAEAMRAYYMKRNGDTLTAWTAVSYAFMSLKGLLLFSVLLLIGTGWSLLKPHLSQRDKSVLSLVLVLQVVGNTAQILESETAVGTRAWVSWRDILLFADVACCAAVLLPIVWSIRQLRVAAATDGKAFANLQKLTQFRSFYLLVISYIYVTRLVIQLLQASLPYDATWVAVAVGELAALAFFTTTGYRFRPLPVNPYLEVPMHEDDLEEFALDDDEDDLDFRNIQRTDIRKFAYGAPVKTKASYSIKSTAGNSSPERASYAKKRSGSFNSDL
ncbi:putative G-protein coupled receptor [Phytophthora cinnamomi]|uniref:putative G-protein coupled receptor n=1 Tax=Phytophthora cinnamomi TaxID=4785 RepID=UPI00355A7E83|nr:putative G-protein coupled receptor [Phytophthora cinnamomi]